MNVIGPSENQSLVVDFDTEDEFKSFVKEKAEDWSADHCLVKWRGPGRYVLACSLVDGEFATWNIPFDDNSTFVLTSSMLRRLH